MNTSEFRAMSHDFVESQRTDRNRANEEAKVLAKLVKAGDEINRNLDKLEEIRLSYEGGVK